MFYDLSGARACQCFLESWIPNSGGEFHKFHSCDRKETYVICFEHREKDNISS